MTDPLRSRNYLALGVLIVGKVLGIAGLAVASSSRTLGGALLVLDGILIVTAVVICLRTMKARDEEDSADKAMLRKMMKEGTLKQHLRDLEDEQRRSPTAARDGDAKADVERQTAVS